ncbi:MAG TPA: RnfABCDGE type electron transport complex subunit D [Gemmatimonadaceae bacterium]
MTLSRFFRTPKGVLILIFAFLLIPAIRNTSLEGVAPGLVGATLAAMALDALVLRIRRRRWHFPDGALLTALIVAMILSPHEPWYVVVITALIAVASKYVIRAHKANIFNPAALALVVSFYVFGTAQDWWGSIPEARFGGVLVLATGLFIAQRTDKLPAVVSFLGVYYLLVTIAAFVGDPAHVAELYRSPDVNATLFFAVFMVTDPPTSPPKARDQVVFGTITAAMGYAAFALIGAAYFLLAGVLVANVWEARRRFMTRHA